VLAALALVARFCSLVAVGQQLTYLQTLIQKGEAVVGQPHWRQMGITEVQLGDLEGPLLLGFLVIQI
jgi:hypothetical protein